MKYVTLALIIINTALLVFIIGYAVGASQENEKVISYLMDTYTLKERGN